MTKQGKLIMVFSTILMVVVLAACTKQDLKTSTEHRKEIVKNNLPANVVALASTLYYSTPTVGNLVPNSSIAIAGTCGIHFAALKATMLSANGSSFTVRVAMQSGAGFGYSGTAYLKENSLCGPIGGSATFLSPSTYIDVTITPNFTQGVKHYYPMIVLSSGNRYYAEPVLIYTIPMYNTSWIYGNVLGMVNGVEVRCNGSTNLSVASTAYNQCTEFCNRYYFQVYSKNIINTGTQGGNASTWFTNASAKGLVSYPNGIATSLPPRPGDILCMSGGSGGYGHVAIIIEVGSTYVKIAQQNTGTTGGVWSPIGASLPYNSTTKVITPPTSVYTVDGWLRCL